MSNELRVSSVSNQKCECMCIHIQDHSKKRISDPESINKLP
jgi:hypothetical protein